MLPNKPAILNLKFPANIPDSLDTFIQAFGSSIAKITGRKGEVLRICKLEEYVQSLNSTVGDDTRKAFEICHWPTPAGLFCDGPVNLMCSAPLEFSNLHDACVLDLDRLSWFPHWEWAILGGQGSSVSIHADMLGTASWNWLVEGEKLWYLWPPSSGGDRFQSPFLTFTQEAGDLIWIPEGWHHSVEYRSASLCYTKNIVRPTSLAAVLTRAMKEESYLVPLLEILHKKFCVR